MPHGEGDVGLEKSVVVLCPHNPLWIRYGQEECEAVRRLLGPTAVDVRHIGSTSVPDLDAKPILDIAAAVTPEAAIADVVSRLTAGGDFSYQGDKGREGGGLLFVRGVGDVRTAHLHVVTSTSEEWGLYLRFQDLLLHDAAARSTYQQEKHRLALEFPMDRLSYTNAKSSIILELLDLDVGQSPHS